MCCGRGTLPCLFQPEWGSLDVLQSRHFALSIPPRMRFSGCVGVEAHCSVYSTLNKVLWCGRGTLLCLFHPEWGSLDVLRSRHIALSIPPWMRFSGFFWLRMALIHSFLNQVLKTSGKILYFGPGGLNVNERLCCKQSVVPASQPLGRGNFVWPVVYSVQGQRSLSTNKIIEIMTKKSDKNQLEPGKGAVLSPKIYQLDSYFIFWSNMKIISFAYSWILMKN